MATPGAQTATSGPTHVKVGEKMPSAATRLGVTVERSHVVSGNSLSRPTAPTASVYGDAAGYCTRPPELPPATMQAIPWRTTSSSFCSIASDHCDVTRLRL